MDLSHLEQTLHLLHHAAAPGRWHAPRHVEDNTEEVDVHIRGRGVYETNRGQFEAGPGAILWFQPGDVLTVTADAETPYEVIVFRFGVSRPAPFQGPSCSVWGDLEACRRFCRTVQAQYLSGTLGEHAPICTYLRLYWESTESARKLTQSRKPEVLRAALDYMEQHACQGIGVEDTAKAVGISATYLRLLFREYVRTTPNRVLTRHRMARAQELLSTTRMPVKEIGYSVGFNDQKHFCERFKTLTGLTPSDYRRRFER